MDKNLVIENARKKFSDELLDISMRNYLKKMKINMFVCKYLF